MECRGWGELDELKARPPQTPPKEGLCYAQDLIVEIGYLFGIAIMMKWKNQKFGVALKHCPSPLEKPVCR